MKRMNKYVPQFVLAFLLIACNDDPAPEDNSLYLEEGYVISSVNESTAGFTYYAGFFDAIPGNTAVDMTAKSTYINFFVHDTFENFMYGPSLKGDQVFSKIAVSKDGRLTEVASFPILSYLNTVHIIDKDLGIYIELGENPMAGMFNPTTMEKLGEIDMSNAKKFAGNDRNSYSSITYRKQDNRLFLALLTDNYNTGQYYDATDVYVEVVNLTTKLWEKTITYEGATYPITRGNQNDMIDENGNIYLFTQGSYGLDGNMGPASPKGSRPQILKIPANTTEFDENYSFNPVTEFGQQNLLVQLMLGAIYDSNGIAYTCISGKSESPRILELVQKFGAGTITEAEFFELRTAVFYSQSQRWVKLDLNAKTVTAIDDIPFTAGFAYPYAYKYNNKFYFEFNNSENSTSGYYEYDPATGDAKEAISINNGGIASEFVKLDNTND